MGKDQLVIKQTIKWINEVVMGCNFCPFAAAVMKHDKVHYRVESAPSRKSALEAFHEECIRLDEQTDIETIFVIFPDAFADLYDYLDLVSEAEQVLAKNGYEGVYQVASFHPLYCFAGEPSDDAANYTNRSPYPMLHILREDRVEEAIERYSNPDQIPERNIRFARDKGEVYMKMLRDSCF